QVLALSQALQQADFEAFRPSAEAYLSQFSDNQVIVVADRDARQVFNTRAARGDTLPVRALRSGAGEVFKTRLPSYSPVFQGSVTGALVITITVPVFRNGDVIYELAFNPPLADFQRILE